MTNSYIGAVSDLVRLTSSKVAVDLLRELARAHGDGSWHNDASCSGITSSAASRFGYGIVPLLRELGMAHVSDCCVYITRKGLHAIMYLDVSKEEK